MTGRHERCEVCGTGRLRVVVLWPRPGEPDELVDCDNPDCPTRRPTGPIPSVTNRDRAAAEVEDIKRGLRDRLRADDTGGWHRREGPTGGPKMEHG